MKKKSGLRFRAQTFNCGFTTRYSVVLVCPSRHKGPSQDTCELELCFEDFHRGPHPSSSLLEKETQVKNRLYERAKERVEEIRAILSQALTIPEHPKWEGERRG